MPFYTPLKKFGGEILPLAVQTSEDKQTKILYKDFFNFKTDKFLLSGLGVYYNVKGKPTHDFCKGDPDFNFHVLQGVVLITSLDKELICGGAVETYYGKKNGDRFGGENPFYNFFFDMSDGIEKLNVANTQKDKNKCIERHIKSLEKGWKN